MDLLMLEDGYGSDIETGLIRPKKEDKLYVAVGKEFRENELNLIWAIQNSGGCKICILHVHQPQNFIPILGERFHWSNLSEQQVKKYRGIEKQFMLKTLDEYLHFCHEFGVQAEKLCIEMDSVERGILQLIADHDIEKLVMGAATDGCYHTEMMEPVSKKAAYVQMLAPAKCQIWFICKGHLIHHRKRCLPVKTHAKNGTMISHSMEGESSKCVAKRENLLLGEGSSHFGTINGRASVPCIDKIGTTHVPLPESDLEAYSHSSISEILQLFDSRGSSTDSLSLLNKRESAADQIEVQRGHVFEQNHHRPLSSPLIIAQEKVSELEVGAARRMEELEKLKIDRDKLREDLQCAMNQNSILESKVANYAEVMNELEEGIISNLELLQVREKECDDLKIERDNVLKNAAELVTQSTEAAIENDALGCVTTFTFTEIERATNDFDPSLQLWEGEDVSVYKGIISHTEVTIKIWHPEGSEFPQDLYREVEILSKFRHPNVVTLIGVCPEAYAVVYEHLPNGNLQKRLNSASNTLSWQTRIRIATELCCALIFLHSRVPERVIHGALKPASIFLDLNFTCKISDFGFSHIIPRHENSLPPELHSSSYTDPQYVMTGLATPAADVYSFGIILMELLTGKSAETVMDELEDAMIDNSFYFLLDTSAGKWPFVQAEQLTRMALRCCDANASGRPDLESDVWRVLEPMRTSCGCSTSNNLGDEEHNQAPSYFICPIFQEAMKDPHIAADGYTYEAEAIRGWLDSGHDTSPMTNLQLQHTNLIPNHALRSAIREWSQRHQLSENA